MNLKKIKHFYFNKYIVSYFSNKKFFLSYCFDHKVLWFRTYKVASRTIHYHLKSNSTKEGYVYSSEAGYLPGMYSDYFKFAFVREPIGKTISAWKNLVLQRNYFNFNEVKLKKMKGFDNFVKWIAEQDLERGDEHLRLQSALIDLNNVDFIGRFENFSQDFAKVAGEIGIQYNENIKKNSSSGQHPPRNLSNEAKGLLKRLYQKDYEVFYPHLIGGKGKSLL